MVGYFWLLFVVLIVGHFFYMRHYTKDSLKNWATKSGYRVIELEIREPAKVAARKDSLRTGIDDMKGIAEAVLYDQENEIEVVGQIRWHQGTFKLTHIEFIPAELSQPELLGQGF